jgi:hypothetical protein
MQVSSAGIDTNERGIEKQTERFSKRIPTSNKANTFNDIETKQQTVVYLERLGQLRPAFAQIGLAISEIKNEMGNKLIEILSNKTCK